MKITVRIPQAVFFGSLKTNPVKNYNPIFKSELPYDTFTFRGQCEKYKLPEEFKPYLNKNNEIEDFLKDTIKKENKIGEGRDSTVYQIPQIPNYVVKKMKPKADDYPPVGIFPEYNLGQAVWQSQKDKRLLILKRQFGEEHSIKDWSNYMSHPNLKLSRGQALQFYYNIAKMAQFDDEAYEKFASSVKILDDGGYKVDSINPNNLLVDYEAHEFNVVDYCIVEPWENVDAQRNSYLDMVAIIVDFGLLDEYLSLLNKDEKEQMINDIRLIHAKSLKAAAKEGLSVDPNRFEKYTAHVQKYLPGIRADWSAQYQKLKDLIPELK